MSTPRELEFKRATLAMAADALTQLGLFPPFVCVGDELVIDWGEALDAVRSERRSPHEAQQEDAISELELRIAKYAGIQNERMFCAADALSDDPRWSELRTLAASLCVAFGWQLEAPASNGATYVRGAGQK